MISQKTILHPTDFSACSRYAFQVATTLAGKERAHLIILHVNQIGKNLAAWQDAFPQGQPGNFRDYLQQVLGYFSVNDPRISWQHLLVEGEPTREILRVAQDCACDVIIMGTHGRSGLERLILGSVAEQVLRKARCPVITVKLPQGHGSEVLNNRFPHGTAKAVVG